MLIRQGFFFAQGDDLTFVKSAPKYGMDPFRCLLQSEVDAVYFSDFGQCITYTRYACAPVTIEAVVDEANMGALSDPDRGKQLEKQHQLILHQADGPFGPRDEFTIEGVVFKWQRNDVGMKDNTQIVWVVRKDDFELGKNRDTN